MQKVYGVTAASHGQFICKGVDETVRRRDLDSGPRALKFEARHANRRDHQGSERIVGVYEVLHPQ
jgi:hypothetical protein